MTQASAPHGVDEDAIELLTTDQDEIIELLESYQSLADEPAGADDREALAEEICSVMLVHATVKEDIFYPAIRDVIDEEYLIDEALVALDSVRSIIDDIQDGDSTEPRYDAQVKILHELVVQHFDEEREQLFPKARAAAIDLVELGAEIAARQELLLTAGEDAETDAP